MRRNGLEITGSSAIGADVGWDMKTLVLVIIAVALAALLFVQHGQAEKARAQTQALSAELTSTKAELDRASRAPKTDPKESDRVNQERAELAKLRGEVTALRKEKAEWLKGRGAVESAALQTAPPPHATTPAAEGMQWVETILNGPAQVKGTEAGRIRAKALAGEPLTEAEQALLMNMNSKAAELEKSPEEFSNFQSAYIASLLGWNNDPRAEAIKGVVNAAMSAATNRGLDFHAPAENADKWSDDQKALNTRATSAVQNLLRPEERAIFDKALIGVLGVDTGAPAAK
jgi:hypothetical protein